MKKEKLEKIIKFRPAYDKRHADPTKNYGIGGVKCYMVLKGKRGAVHFIFGTGMYLPETHRNWLSKFPEHDPVRYMGYDVGYHSFEPQYKGQDSILDCDWLNGKECYGDGSTLMAEEWMDIFVREGDEKIWQMLEEYYYDEFKL